MSAVITPCYVPFDILRRPSTARWQRWRAARQTATIVARPGTWSSVSWCRSWTWRMTATLCSTSSPTRPSQTRKSCPPPCPVAASPSSTSIQTLTRAKCTSRRSRECLVSICGSVSAFLVSVLRREFLWFYVCVCVCVCARVHNCHLKGCFTSASFHPHRNCKLEDRLWVRSLSSLFSIPAWLPNLSKRPV